MARPMDLVNKYWKLGAIVGAALPYVLNILGKVPGINVTQSTISLNVQNVNTGLASWAFNVFGANVGLPQVLMSALGGILFVVLGAFVVEQLNLYKLVGVNTKLGRLAMILFVAGLASGWIIDFALNIPGVGVIISNVVGAVALGFIVITLDDMLKLKLVNV